jgi:hypothetical protein
MMKASLILFVLTCCGCHAADTQEQQVTDDNSQAVVELWGDDSTGYCVRSKFSNGEEYFKYSYYSSDTAAMKADALKWRKSQIELIII